MGGPCMHGPPTTKCVCNTHPRWVGDWQHIYVESVCEIGFHPRGSKGEITKIRVNLSEIRP